jgi:hypothetical protein
MLYDCLAIWSSSGLQPMVGGSLIFQRITSSGYYFKTFKESSIFMKDQLVLCWFFSNFLTLKMFTGLDLEVWITNKHYFQGWSQG